MRFIAPRTGAPEQTIAEEQGEYLPVTVARYFEPERVLMRATFTPEERAQIMAGADVYICLMTFGEQQQPIQVQVGPDSETKWTVPE